MKKKEKKILVNLTATQLQRLNILKFQLIVKEIFIFLTLTKEKTMKKKMKTKTQEVWQVAWVPLDDYGHPVRRSAVRDVFQTLEFWGTDDPDGDEDETANCFYAVDDCGAKNIETLAQSVGAKATYFCDADELVECEDADEDAVIWHCEGECWKPKNPEDWN